MNLIECLIEMIEISNNENNESGFLVLHSNDGEHIISDIVVGKGANSLSASHFLKYTWVFARTGHCIGHINMQKMER